MTDDQARRLGHRHRLRVAQLDAPSARRCDRSPPCRRVGYQSPVNSRGGRGPPPHTTGVVAAPATPPAGVLRLVTRDGLPRETRKGAAEVPSEAPHPVKSLIEKMVPTCRSKDSKTNSSHRPSARRRRSGGPPLKLRSSSLPPTAIHPQRGRPTSRRGSPAGTCAGRTPNSYNRGPPIGGDRRSRWIVPRPARISRGIDVCIAVHCGPDLQADCGGCA